MKKILSFFAVAALLAAAVSCDPKDDGPKTQDVTIQLTLDGAELALEGATVNLSDGTTNFTAVTGENGAASFKVIAGTYSATVSQKVIEDGAKISYNGSNTAIAVVAGGENAFQVALNKVQASQIIIKELLNGGSLNSDGKTTYANDDYIILYNNSDVEADASDIVFCFAAPYNGNGTNKYYGEDGKLKYENEDWIPAYGAIWWFSSPVKIPAYSQIVIAVWGAIDHTASNDGSVDLSKPEYYWMSNKVATAYTMAKYQVSESIPQTNYLDAAPYTMGTAWALSNASPAFYIAKMSKADAKALSENKEAFDATLGTTAAFYVAKMPQANVVDALEVWAADKIDASQVRFPASINTGYVALTNKKGHTLYRNVDKAETEALPENEGKLVYNYAGGTYDAATNSGSTDPSGIDAEASIANGAHIIYSDTNNTTLDFHERAVASIKK